LQLGWHATDSAVTLWAETAPHMVNSTSAESALERAKPLLAQSLSKAGSFFLAQRELDGLVGRLSEAQAVALYLYLRDESSRLEMEWRGEFVAAFPEADLALPAPTVWEMASLPKK